VTLYFFVWMQIDTFAVFVHFMQRSARVWMYFTLRSIPM